MFFWWLSLTWASSFWIFNLLKAQTSTWEYVVVSRIAMTASFLCFSGSEPRCYFWISTANCTRVDLKDERVGVEASKSSLYALLKVLPQPSSCLALQTEWPDCISCATDTFSSLASTKMKTVWVSHCKLSIVNHTTMQTKGKQKRTIRRYFFWFGLQEFKHIQWRHLMFHEYCYIFSLKCWWNIWKPLKCTKWYCFS